MILLQCAKSRSPLMVCVSVLAVAMTHGLQAILMVVGKQKPAQV
jgi:hypothetical protein